MFENKLFGEKELFDPKCDVIFVSDVFIDDYVGGAELTSQALIDESPYKVSKVHSRDVTLDLLKKGHEKFWLFGNFADMNSNLIPTIIGNIKYSVVEYDFKYCRYRSPEKHQVATGQPCDCHDQMNGKVVSAFYHGAQGLWWMSEKQMQVYHHHYPFLADNFNWVLSSVFDKKTLAKLKILRENIAKPPIQKWITCGSKSWIKGAAAGEQWCKDNNKDYEVVWDISYDEMLAKFASSYGFVFLPPGADTCPRQVIEAKLLNCELHLNDNVLHKDEEWFNTSDLSTIESYLYHSPSIFWNDIKNMIDRKPTISGYVTTLNCIRQGYPYMECIKSMLEFCDEVCVVDGGSDDGTWSELNSLQLSSAFGNRVVLKQVVRDWNHPRFSVFDGLQKAEARAMCTSDLCWQMDADEVVHEDDVEKILKMVSSFPKGVDLVALPVIEYWGKNDKVRCDITPWKWRMSNNRPNITHGIPKELRLIDENGDLYARQGTDGCDYIDAKTFERIPFVNFYNVEIDNVRSWALNEDKNSLLKYQEWFNAAINQLPCVFHYSWINFERKIRLYRDTWTRHWQSLYNLSIEDTAANNMFFDKQWSEVTDEDIKKLSNELEKTGGHIWHTKWNHEIIPHLTIQRTQPKIMIR